MCHGPLHLEGEEVTEVCLRYAGSRAGDLVELCLTYTTRYFSLYESADILFLNPFRNPKSIAELVSTNVMWLVTRSLFVWGGVTYPPRDEILMNLQVPTGNRETDRHTRALYEAWALARNEASARESLDLHNSPTHPDVEGCRYVVLVSSVQSNTKDYYKECREKNTK